MRKKAEIKCPIDGCDGAFFTQTGLDFHIKNKHGEVEKIPEKKVSIAKKPKPKAPKKTIKDESIDVDKVVKQALEVYKAMKKKMRKEPIELKIGQKLSAKQLIKLLKHDPVVNISNGSSKLRAKPWTRKNLSDWIGKDSFKVTSVNEKNNNWIIYIIESKRLKITWKEGPIKGKHNISYPTVIHNG